jgi:hypothetical protein
MPLYDLSFGVMVTEGGSPFLSVPPFTFHHMNEQAVGAMVGLALGITKELDKAKNKGGAIQVVLSADAKPLDGGPVPPGLGKSATYGGLTRHSFQDVEDSLFDVGKKLAKFGRDRATQKEGPHK